MANVLTPKDCHAILNELTHLATGQYPTTQIVDTSTFVSVGETVLATGTENVLNSLGILIGRTLSAVRPYKAKLMILNALNSGLYSNRIRKISYYSRDSLTAGNFNTDLKTNLSQGYDNGTNSGNSTMSQWEQNQPVVMEMNFGGSDVWQDSTTIYEEQLKIAFSSESDFATFMGAILTEKGNDIESQKESFNRMALINFMAGVYALNSVNGSAINLTTEFNRQFGTSYTSEELRGVYQSDFAKWFVAYVKTVSDKLENRSKKYHWSPAKTVNGHTYTLLRHTPKDKQKLVLFQPFFTQAKTQVLSELFNPGYLDMGNYEGVNFWQNENVPAEINVTPAIVDTDSSHTTYGTRVAGSTVHLDYVLGFMFDTDALMVDYQLESALSTSLEARKRYRNIWYSFARNVLADYTENAIIFYMAD